MGDGTNPERHDPDIELYAVAELDGDVRDGIRIYRSDDAVYEAWSSEDAAIRCYEDDGTWQVKVRFPEQDIEDAYNRLITTAEEVNDAYGTALDISPKRFRERVESDDEVILADGETTLHYREETDLDELIEAVAGDPTKASLAKAVVTDVATEAAEGTVIGAVVGSIAGPPGVVATAAAWGGIWGGLSVVRNGVDLARGGSGPRTTRFFEERRKKQYKAVDVVEDHLESVNRLHSLEAEVEATREMDMAKHDELAGLEEDGVEDAHDLLMQLHFHRYEEGDGVMAMHTTDTYEEAAAFITAVTGNTVPRQRPSLYTARDAFTTVFDHLTYMEHDEQNYLDDAAVLARNAHNHGTDEVTAWLKQQHAGFVHDAAQ